ncbi:MAG: anthranilate synthase component II [bacterium]
MILLIDNYDSFTWNLFHLVAGLTDEPVVVHRNDAMTVTSALDMQPTAIILSPGPSTPDHAGICLELIEAAAQIDIPILGVCLGHQAIAQAHGGRIVRAGQPLHGKTSQVRHKSTHIFKQIENNFTATRYHSLVVDPSHIPAPIEPLAHACDDGEIMGLKIRDKDIYGVQFHPESIASEAGGTILANFLATTRTGNV